MMMPNATALALDRHPDRAGTAAAVMGGIQSVIAALVAAPLAGLGDRRARACRWQRLILGFAATALLVLDLLARSRPLTAADRPDAGVSARRPRRTGPRASPPPGPGSRR